MVPFPTKVIRPKIARAINDSGAIVGTATYTQQSPSDPIAAGSHGVLLLPCQYSLLNGNQSGVDGLNFDGTRPTKISQTMPDNSLPSIDTIGNSTQGNGGIDLLGIDLSPSWIAPNPSSDYVAANLGQLKTVFNFDLSLAGLAALNATTNTGGTVNLSWTLPTGNQAASWLVEQQNPDGSWSIVSTITNPATTTYAVSNLAAGENPAFQIIAQNGRSVSVATATPPDTRLTAPSNVNAVAGAAAGEIDLTWQNNATDATYTSINESPDGVNWSSIAIINNTNTTFYAVTNLTVGQSYYFGVSAGNN